jgi:hypothetical protein
MFELLVLSCIRPTDGKAQPMAGIADAAIAHHAWPTIFALSSRLLMTM